MSPCAGPACWGMPRCSRSPGSCFGQAPATSSGGGSLRSRAGASGSPSGSASPRWWPRERKENSRRASEGVASSHVPATSALALAVDSRFMKAIVCHRYGAPETLRLEDVEKPTPGDSEVLIQVRAASLNAMDWHFMKGRPAIARLFLGLRRPKLNRPGYDVTGRVESVGRSVTQFKPGDDVFGACRGSLAEYACAKESYLARKPANVSFEEAAAVPVAGLTALQGLRDHGRVQPGQ